MFSYKFYVRTDKKDALMLRLTNNRKKAELALGLRMTEETLSDAMSQRAKPGNLRYKSLLDTWRVQIDDVKIELIKEGRGDEDVVVIKELVKKALFNVDDAGDDGGDAPTGKEGTFKPFFIQHKDYYERRSTRESNEYTLSVMEKFSEKRGVPLDTLKFEDISYAWLSDFETYMKKEGMSQNTRKIHFGNIRAAIRDAYKRELTEADPFRRFSFRPAKTRKRSMEVDKLRELFDCPVLPFAELYRDMMKLSFMLLGINTVDLYNLRVIRDGRVEYDRSKTGGLFSVKVEPEAMEIIEKYKGERNLLMLADRWSDHRNFRHQMNAAIKRIGKAQGKGIKDKEGDGPFAEVTSYWMRHTWATVAYEVGVSDDVISQALGHQGSGTRVTEVYIRRNMEKVDDANRKVLDWVLYGKR